MPETSHIEDQERAELVRRIKELQAENADLKTDLEFYKGLSYRKSEELSERYSL